MFRRRLWGRREVSLKVKMKICNAVLLPVLLYGATACALTRTEQRRLYTLEVGMLRSIAGVRWDDFVRNVDIRERLEQPPVSLKLRSARTKWLGHVERMGEERQVKRLLKTEMQGRRPVGRPRTRWKDVILRDLERSPGLGPMEDDGAGLMRLQRRKKLSMYKILYADR